MNNKKIAAGFLVILGAGIVVSLLLNSKKGRQARRDLLRKGNRLTEDLKGKFNEFVDQVSEKVQGIVK